MFKILLIVLSFLLNCIVFSNDFTLLDKIIFLCSDLVTSNSLFINVSFNTGFLLGVVFNNRFIVYLFENKNEIFEFNL